MGSFAMSPSRAMVAHMVEDIEEGSLRVLLKSAPIGSNPTGSFDAWCTGTPILAEERVAAAAVVRHGVVVGLFELIQVLCRNGQPDAHVVIGLCKAFGDAHAALEDDADEAMGHLQAAHALLQTFDGVLKASDADVKAESDIMVARVRSRLIGTHLRRLMALARRWLIENGKEASSSESAESVAFSSLSRIASACAHHEALRREIGDGVCSEIAELMAGKEQAEDVELVCDTRIKFTSIDGEWYGGADTGLWIQRCMMTFKLCAGEESLRCFCCRRAFAVASLKTLAPTAKHAHCRMPFRCYLCGTPLVQYSVSGLPSLLLAT